MRPRNNGSDDDESPCGALDRPHGDCVFVQGRANGPLALADRLYTVFVSTPIARATGE